MPSQNKFIIAAAGTGKTTFLVDEAASFTDEPTLITTFTNNGCDEIRAKFIERHGSVPSWVTIRSWYQFLLADCVRPYQATIYPRRVSTIFFPDNPGTFYLAHRRISANDIKNYYFVDADRIIERHVSKFAVHCNLQNSGAVLSRIGDVYKHVLIDESQDLAGWDLDFIEQLLSSRSRVLIVGDPRQCTYSTNHSPKNRGKNGANVLSFFTALKAKNLIEIDSLDKSFRCNQAICDFANAIYSDMPPMRAVNDTVDGEGVYFVTPDIVRSYYDSHAPKVLRWDKRVDTLSLPASNFGDVKGLTFENVLIFPTPSMVKYLEGGQLDKSKQLSVSKFYVAVTRARRKVIFVYQGTKPLTINKLPDY